MNCTGWKVGWAVGPSDLIKQAMFVHEAINFNQNVPGQIAIARSLEQAFEQPYQGHKNYLDYTRYVFEQGRNEASKLL